jgi:hypothetical protein
MMMATTIMSQILGYDPYDTDVRTGVEELPDEYYRLLPENFTAEAFAQLDASAVLFAYYWSGEMMRGLKTLAALPTERVLTIHFEDILAEPERWLGRLIEFIAPEFADDQWLKTAVTTIRSVRSCWRSLPPQGQSILTEACRPGFEALAEQGLARGAGVGPGCSTAFWMASQAREALDHLNANGRLSFDRRSR